MTPELREKVAGRLVVASVSGGKDSAAMCLWLQEQGIEHRRVFADTGWEHPLTYEYLRGPLTKALGPIDEVRNTKGGMEDFVLRHKQVFPSRVMRFCTQELKVRPLVAYVSGVQDEAGEVVSAVGIRAAESEARSKMPEWEWGDDFDCDVWRPLLRWTEQEVIDIHHRHGLAPNPLYLKGATRVGCWPCIFARKAEIKLLADISPERIDRIRELEAEVAKAQNARAAAKGEVRARPHSTFFYGRSADSNGQTGIDDAVAWARTGKGGRQYDLIEQDQPEGCVRWGLCESGGDK